MKNNTSVLCYTSNGTINFVNICCVIDPIRGGSMVKCMPNNRTYDVIFASSLADRVSFYGRQFETILLHSSVHVYENL